jgi:hypothetical protein
LADPGKVPHCVGTKTDRLVVFFSTSPPELVLIHIWRSDELSTIRTDPAVVLILVRPPKYGNVGTGAVPSPSPASAR